MFMLNYVLKLVALCIIIATCLIAGGVYKEWQNVKCSSTKDIIFNTCKCVAVVATNMFIFVVGMQLLSFCIWAFLTSFS